MPDGEERVTEEKVITLRVVVERDSGLPVDLPRLVLRRLDGFRIEQLYPHEGLILRTAVIDVEILEEH